MRRVGVILAGGQGRRLGGVDKPLLVHPNGDALLDRVARCLRSATDEVVVVGGPRADVQDAGEGPARAVAMVAQRHAGAWLVVTAADLARPQASLFARLAQPGAYDVLMVGSFAGLVFGMRSDFAAFRREPSFRAWWTRANIRSLRTRNLTAAERAGLADIDRSSEVRAYRLGVAACARKPGRRW